MPTRLIIIIAIAAISVFCLGGCKKKSNGEQAEEVVVKTVAEYERQAKEEINEENIEAELDRLEKSIDAEIE